MIKFAAAAGLLDPWRAVQPGDVLVVRRTGKLAFRLRVTEVEPERCPIPLPVRTGRFVWGDEITRTGRIRFRGGGGRGRCSKYMQHIVRYTFIHEIVEIIRPTTERPEQS